MNKTNRITLTLINYESRLTKFNDVYFIVYALTNKDAPKKTYKLLVFKSRQPNLYKKLSQNKPLAGLQITGIEITN